jgi:outer membrane protein assembly factor BamB
MLITAAFIVLAGLLAEVPSSTPALAPAPASAAADAKLEPLWSTPLGQLRQTSLLRAGPVGDALLVVDGRNGVSAIEFADGTPRWLVQLSGPLAHWPNEGADTVTLSSGTRSVVVELSTGRRLFELDSAELPAGSPVSDGRLVYVPSLLDDTLTAIDMQSGMQAWEYRLPARFASGAQLIGGEGRTSVLVASDDGKLRAVPAGLDVPRGERWVRHVGTLLAPPVVSGERIYVTTVGRELIALDAGSGEVEWKHLPGEPLAGAPVVVGESIVLATHTRLLSLSADTGAVEWEQPAAGTPVGLVGDTVLVSGRAGSAGLRDAASGSDVPAQLPQGAHSAAGLVVALQRSSDVAAWRLVRR